MKQWTKICHANTDQKKAEVAVYIYIYIYIYFLIYFLAALGLCCCMGASSSCGEQGLLFVVVGMLLIAVASLVAGHGLSVHGLQ